MTALTLVGCFAERLGCWLAANEGAEIIRLNLRRDGMYEVLVCEATYPSGRTKTGRIKERRDGRERWAA